MDASMKPMISVKLSSLELFLKFVCLLFGISKTSAVRYMKSKVRPFDDILRSNYCKESQWASKLQQLTQNINAEFFSSGLA